MKNSREFKEKKFSYNHNRLYLLLIFVFTLFMSVGYATINSITLEHSGTVAALAGEELFISNVIIDEENTLDGINLSNVTNGTFLKSTIVLDDVISSKLTLLVNVCNNFNENYIFSDLRYMDLTDEELSLYPEFSNLYSNGDIVIDESSYSSLIGTILSAKECMDVPVTFKYVDELEIVTDNQLDVTMNFKFDSLDTYESNIVYEISSTTGEFLDYETELTYDLTVTNNNNYPIKISIGGSSNNDIILSGISSDSVVVNAKSSNVTMFTLSPAREKYIDSLIISIDVSVSVSEPVSLSSKNYTINVNTFAPSLTDLILDKNEIVQETPVFTGNVTSEEGSGLFETIDESGTSYYFRGVISNNYVDFAGYLWRIIRINGDGTYRLILNTNIGRSVFSTDTSSTWNCGYMYGSTVRANTTSSEIKNYLEDWYVDNLQTFDDYIDKDAIFWQDRTYNTSNKVYAGWTRVVDNSPTLIPTVKDDMFSVTTTKGNGKLTKPIGLITADEVVLAGGTMTGATTTGWGTHYENKAYYLYTGEEVTYGFWTMTPRRVGSSAAANHMIVSKIQAVIFSEPPVTTTRYVRPVINLKKDVVFTGSGTPTNPYVVSIN